MSTVYTSTKPFYAITDNIPSFVILPSDGDPLFAASANIFEKKIFDGNNAVFESLCKLPNSNSSIRAVCSDGINIKIAPFSVEVALTGTYYFVKTVDEISINSSNLEGGGGFMPNTWYYVYYKVTAGPTFTTVISTTAPHKYKLYRDNAGAQDLTSKYLLSFKVLVGMTILPFKKLGHQTKYMLGLPLLAYGTHVGAGAPALVDCSLFVPPTAGSMYSLIAFRNRSVMSSNVASLYCDNNVSHLFMAFTIGAEVGASSNEMTSEYSIPFNTTSTFGYEISTTTAPLSGLTITATGYTE